MSKLLFQVVWLLMYVLVLAGCPSSKRNVILEAAKDMPAVAVANTDHKPEPTPTAPSTSLEDKIVGRWLWEGSGANLLIFGDGNIVLEFTKENRVSYLSRGKFSVEGDNELTLVDQGTFSVTAPSPDTLVLEGERGVGVICSFHGEDVHDELLNYCRSAPSPHSLILRNRQELSRPTKPAAENLIGTWAVTDGGVTFHYRFAQDGSVVYKPGAGDKNETAIARYELSNSHLRIYRESDGKTIDFDHDIVFLNDDFLLPETHEGLVLYRVTPDDPWGVTPDDPWGVTPNDPASGASGSVSSALKDKLIGHWKIDSGGDIYMLKEGIAVSAQDGRYERLFMYRVTGDNELTLRVAGSKEELQPFTVIQPDNNTVILQGVDTIILRNRQDVVSTFGETLHDELIGNWFFENSDTGLRSLRRYRPNGDLLVAAFDPSDWVERGEVWDIYRPTWEGFHIATSVYFLIDGDLLQFAKSLPAEDFSSYGFVGTWRRTSEEFREATRDDFIGVWDAADQRCCGFASLEFFADGKTLLIGDDFRVGKNVGTFSFDETTHTLKMTQQKDHLVVNYNSSLYARIRRSDDASFGEEYSRAYVAQSTIAQAFVINGKLVLESDVKTLIGEPFNANFHDGAVITNTNGVTYTINVEELQRYPIYTTLVRPEGYVAAVQSAQDVTVPAAEMDLPMGVNEWEGVSSAQEHGRVDEAPVDPATAQIFTDWQPAESVPSLRDAIIGKWEFTNPTGENHWVEYSEDGEFIHGIGDRRVRGTFTVDEEADQLSVVDPGRSEHSFKYISDNTVVIENIEGGTGGTIVQRRLDPRHPNMDDISYEESILLGEITGAAEMWLQTNLELSTAQALSITCVRQQDYVAKAAMSNTPWAIVLKSFGLDYKFEFDVKGETMSVDRGEALVLVTGTIYGGPGGVGKIVLGEIWRMVYEDHQWKWCGDGLAD